jgi:hypothetical protein
MVARASQSPANSTENIDSDADTGDCTYMYFIVAVVAAAGVDCREVQYSGDEVSHLWARKNR